MVRTDRITVKEAAEILGMSQQGVKEHMKRNLFDPPIGHVTEITEGRKQYHIYRNLVDKYISMQEPELPQEAPREKTPEERIGAIILTAIKQIVEIAVETPAV